MFNNIMFINSTSSAINITIQRLPSKFLLINSPNTVLYTKLIRGAVRVKEESQYSLIVLHLLLMEVESLWRHLLPLNTLHYCARLRD